MISFPIGKVNSSITAALQIVENAKNDLVKLVKSGKLATLNEINDETQKILLKGLAELGIKTDMSKISQYFPHRVSHWIGLDVHDSSSVSGDFKLQKGCAFSIEPGLYFRQNIENCPKELIGVGIRFEDTVIID